MYERAGDFGMVNPELFFGDDNSLFSMRMRVRPVAELH